MTQNTKAKTEQPRAGWLFRLGLTVLIVGWLSPLPIPVIIRTVLATEWKTIISGWLAVGIPEVFSLAAIAIMGKQGYDLIKDRIFRFLKKHGPPDRVSLTRYRIGLVIVLAPSCLRLVGALWGPPYSGLSGASVCRERGRGYDVFYKHLCAGRRFLG